MKLLPGKLRGSLVAHTGWQLGARGYTAAAQLLAYALVGAIGSDHMMAVYAVSMAAAGLMGTAVDFGTGLWMVREIAKGGRRPRLEVPRVVMLGLCATALTAAGLLHVVPIAAVPWIFVSGAVIGCSGLWRGVLWGSKRYDVEATASATQATLLIAGLAILLLGQISIISGPLVVAAVAFGAGYVVRVRWGRRLAEHDPHRMPFRVWLREVYSYAGQELVVSAQTQLDVLLLGMLWVGPAAGLAAYGLAMRFYYAIGMPFESLGTAVLPRVAGHELIAWKKVIRWAVPVGLAALAGMAVLTSLGTLFGLSSAGADYLRSVGLILLVALPFRFAAYVLGAVVTGSGHQRARLVSAAIGLTTMVGLDVLLIPLHGPVGAAVALTCADVALMTGYAAAVRRALRSVPA